MLWTLLAIAVTLTGVVFAIDSNNDVTAADEDAARSTPPPTPRDRYNVMGNTLKHFPAR